MSGQSPKERLRAVQKAARKRGDRLVDVWCDLALHDARPHVRQEAISELSKLGAFGESTDR